MLADILGKPMIQHVWERVKQCRILDEVLIACDDKKVAEAAKKFGARAVMTSPDLNSGTDRIAAAVKDVKVDIVINIQGDEPLVRPEPIDALAQAMIDDKHCPMATVIKKIQDPAELNNPNVVKVVVAQDGNALYFSRSMIPFNRDNKDFAQLLVYKHFGFYAYQKDFLLKFNKLPDSSLEQTEKLEQLRVLEAGYKIKTVLSIHDTIAVDTQEDLDRVREALKNKR